jgi:hypothetical protein
VVIKMHINTCALGGIQSCDIRAAYDCPLSAVIICIMTVTMYEYGTEINLSSKIMFNFHKITGSYKIYRSGNTPFPPNNSSSAFWLSL